MLFSQLVVSCKNHLKSWELLLLPTKGHFKHTGQEHLAVNAKADFSGFDSGCHNGLSRWFIYDIYHTDRSVSIHSHTYIHSHRFQCIPICQHTHECGFTLLSYIIYYFLDIFNVFTHYFRVCIPISCSVICFFSDRSFVCSVKEIWHNNLDSLSTYPCSVNVPASIPGTNKRYNLMI